MAQEVVPIKSAHGWPIVHLNGNTAKSTTLKNGSGRANYFISGYQLDGALATGNGFYLLRRSCLYFASNNTWTGANGGALLDWTDDTAGHFTLEMWVNIPVATGAVSALLVRGSASDGWVLSVGATGVVTFTVDDSNIGTALTITSTSSILGGWHLITVQCERASTTGLKLFIDGLADATAKTTALLTEAVNPAATLVCTGESSDDMWVGPIGIYHGTDAVLSAATILANYNDGLGRKYHGSETGLVLAWNNDEGTGSLCYDIKNVDGYKATVSGTTWSPSKQSGATAEILKCGPPFSKKYEDDADNPLPTLGFFGTGILTTQGVMNAIVVTFPEAIEMGAGNPVRILETNGSFSLILYGRNA